MALSCARCNFLKGPNLSGIDPSSGAVVRLFHPRRDKWIEHFRWEGPRLVGRTDCGRATVTVLGMNGDVRVEAREQLMLEGLLENV